MKKLILMAFVVHLTSHGYAQNASTKYDTCYLLAQYEGEWKYTDGQVSIRLFLRAHQDYNLSSNRITDRIYGWLEYKDGSNIIESNWQYKDMVLPYYNDSSDSLNVLQWSATLSLKECTNSYPELLGTLIDHMQSNEIQIVTAIPNSSRTLLLWKQTRREGYGMGTGATGMTLPREFLLVKQ